MKSKALEKYVKYTKIPLVSAAFMCVIMIIYAVVFGTASDLESDDTAGEVLSVGDRGGEVWRVQEKLRELGYYRGESSGIYDRATSEAVRKFQLDEGLCADGSAGAAELDALGIYADPSSPMLDIGSAGQDVLRLQRALRRLGIYGGALSGRYGSLTASAVREFQSEHGLRVTGTADGEVLRLLGLDGSDSAPYDEGRAYRLDLLARFAETVAADEPYAAKVAAAAVVLNREADSDGTLTLATLVRLIACEFGGSDIVLASDASPQSKRAAHDALFGCDPTGGARGVAVKPVRGDGSLKIGGIWFY